MEGGDEKERTSTNRIEPTAPVIIEVVTDATSSSAFDPLEDTGREKVKGEAVVVDLESGGKCSETEREKNCRICHLNSELVGSTEEGWELIEIGCGCKGELGIAHRRCAEAWFRVKGNSSCTLDISQHKGDTKVDQRLGYLGNEKNVTWLLGSPGISIFG